MNSNKNFPRRVERIATLAAKAAQIAATRVVLTDCDEAILDVQEAAFITQEAQELAKALIEKNEIWNTVEEAAIIAQNALLLPKLVLSLGQTKVVYHLLDCLALIRAKFDIIPQF
jgi:hypothetical protein